MKLLHEIFAVQMVKLCDATSHYLLLFPAKIMHIGIKSLSRVYVWSLGYGIQFQTWGLQARMALPSMFGIQLLSQCLLLNVDFECQISI